MIRFARDQVRLSLPKDLYARESLEAGALAVSGRAEVYLESKGRDWDVTLRRAAGRAPAPLRETAGEFLTEALSHGYRQAVIRFDGDLTQPVLGRLLERRFPAPRPDPLEELEPQVARDRTAEADSLLAKAKTL